MDIIPDYKTVIFFMALKSPTMGKVEARAVKERYRRLLAVIQAVECGTVPWANQEAQEEVNQFYQAFIVVVKLGRSELYERWVDLETQYLRRKLAQYSPQMRAICKANNIRVYKKKKGKQDCFFMPWSQATDGELQFKGSRARLAIHAMSPFSTLAKGRAILRKRFRQVEVSQSVLDQIWQHFVQIEQVEEDDEDEEE